MTLNDDQKTYIIAGAAGAVSLIAWLSLVVVPAWKSYWRVRDRLVATLLSVYVLGAFVLGLLPSGSAGNTFILMTMMAIALVPTPKRRRLVVLMDCVAVVQI